MLRALNRAGSSAVERWFYTPDVAGSKPVPPTILNKFNRSRPPLQLVSIGLALRADLGRARSSLSVVVARWAGGSKPVRPTFNTTGLIDRTVTTLDAHGDRGCVDASANNYSKRIARGARVATAAVTKETERSNAAAAWMRLGWKPTGGADGGCHPTPARNLRTCVARPVGTQIAIPFPASSNAIPAMLPC